MGGPAEVLEISVTLLYPCLVSHLLPILGRRILRGEVCLDLPGHPKWSPSYVGAPPFSLSSWSVSLLLQNAGSDSSFPLLSCVWGGGYAFGLPPTLCPITYQAAGGHPPSAFVPLCSPSPFWVQNRAFCFKPPVRNESEFVP